MIVFPFFARVAGLTAAPTAAPTQPPTVVPTMAPTLVVLTQTPTPAVLTQAPTLAVLTQAPTPGVLPPSPTAVPSYPPAFYVDCRVHCAALGVETVIGPGHEIFYTHLPSTKHFTVTFQIYASTTIPTSGLYSVLHIWDPDLFQTFLRISVSNTRRVYLSFNSLPVSEPDGPYLPESYVGTWTTITLVYRGGSIDLSTSGEPSAVTTFSVGAYSMESTFTFFANEAGSTGMDGYIRNIEVKGMRHRYLLFVVMPVRVHDKQLTPSRCVLSSVMEDPTAPPTASATHYQAPQAVDCSQGCSLLASGSALIAEMHSIYEITMPPRDFQLTFEAIGVSLEDGDGPKSVLSLLGEGGMEVVGVYTTSDRHLQLVALGATIVNQGPALSADYATEWNTIRVAFSNGVISFSTGWPDSTPLTIPVSDISGPFEGAGLCVLYAGYLEPVSGGSVRNIVIEGPLLYFQQ